MKTVMTPSANFMDWILNREFSVHSDNKGSSLHSDNREKIKYFSRQTFSFHQPASFSFKYSQYIAGIGHDWVQMTMNKTELNRPILDIFFPIIIYPQIFFNIYMRQTKYYMTINIKWFVENENSELSITIENNDAAINKKAK